jgi:uncharacterized RDD family membrane protein YckC
LPDYAGFGQRLLAALVDGLIFFVVSAPISIFFFEASAAMPLIAAVAVVAFWRYCGATPGKLAAAVRIVDARTGQPVGTGRLALRLLCYLVSALPLYLGFLWIAFDRRKQGWHDKIAGTVVIHERD